MNEAIEQSCACPTCPGEPCGCGCQVKARAENCRCCDESRDNDDHG